MKHPPTVSLNGIIFRSLVTLLFFADFNLLAQEPDWVYSVQLSATVQGAPPQITLAWEPDQFGAASYTVYRKAKTAASWGSPIATLSGSAASCADTSVAVGSTYEYQVVKVGTLGYTAYGYIYSGVAAPMTDSRGKLVLLVATNATGNLGPELARLQSDLIGDGWQVIRHDISSNDTPAHARSLVVADYNSDPGNVNAVFLFGHVPVLQSGFINYDGHGPRPMPADGFYGDMNGDWSSSPSTFPSDVELMVGRVDFADMPGVGAPSPWPNETELLRNYLNKDHRWRFAQMPAQRRGLIADRFGTFNGETRASTGYRTLEPFVGPGNTVLADISDTASPANRWISMLSAGGTWLWTYGNGGGQDTSISELGLHGQYNDVWSTDIVAQDPKAVFFMLEGSHFGNWDRPDDIMRAVLAAPTMGLTVCCIAGHPQYYIHHMGLGEPIGYGIRVTMNDTTLYQDTTNEFSRAVYIALMGDPALRMEPIAPVSGFGGSASAGAVNLNWSASPDANAGYHIYRAASPSGPFTRLTTSLVTTTSYRDSGPPSGVSTYMVRAVALQTNPSGSYFNPSQGVFVSVNTSGAANTPPTITAIADQTTTAGVATPPIAFSVNDAETAGSSLVLQGASGNQTLVPDSAIVFGGNNHNRTVSVTPAAGQTGSVTINISVSDGTATAATSFLLTVNAPTNSGPGDLSGAYSGLFYEADQIRQNSSGAFAVTINSRGHYTGCLILGARRYPFAGKLDDQGIGTNVVSHGHDQPLSISFQAGSGDQAGQITGQISNGSWVAGLSAYRSSFNARSRRASWTGNYTLILPGTNGDSALPAGDGFAVVHVSASGHATMSGTLADGTSFSQSASLSPAGAWPVYVPLYSGQGSLVSWLTFVTRPDDDLNGIVNWIKPADSRSRFYAPGFTEQILAVGSAYHRPPGTSSVIDLASGTVAFSGGNLAGPFTNKITIGKSSRVTNQSPNRLNLSFAPATGRFAGNVTAPGGGKPMPFKGVAFQRLNSGFGFMLGTNQTSRVIVGP